MKIRRKLSMNYLLDHHGTQIGAALCALSTTLVVAAVVLLFVAKAPDAITQLLKSSREAVAESRR